MEGRWAVSRTPTSLLCGLKLHEQLSPRAATPDDLMEACHSPHRPSHLRRSGSRLALYTAWSAMMPKRREAERHEASGRKLLGSWIVVEKTGIDLPTSDAVRRRLWGSKLFEATHWYVPWFGHTQHTFSAGPVRGLVGSGHLDGKAPAFS
jgi:hypothetical protein